MRRTVLLIGLLVLTACGGGLKAPTPATTAPTATVAFRASLAPAAATMLPEGRPPLRLTINEYRPRLEPQATQRCTLSAGNDHFAAVDVTILNAGTKPLAISWAYASLTDAQGRQYADKGCDHLVPPDFPTGAAMLAPGEQARGWMTFKLPPDAVPTRYRYDDGGVSMSAPLP